VLQTVEMVIGQMVRHRLVKSVIQLAILVMQQQMKDVLIVVMVITNNPIMLNNV